MLKLIKSTTPADAERVADTAPPVRYRETSESAIAAAQRMQRSYSAKQPEPAQHLWADALHQSEKPEPADASTDVGAEPTTATVHPTPQDIRSAVLTVLGWVSVVATTVALVATFINHAPKP